MSAQHSTNYGNGEKTIKSYLTGLILALILTCLAFGAVSQHWFSLSGTYAFIIALAVVQLVVHVICFLRLNFSKEGRWNTLPFLFTILVILVILLGSLWIMYNLNYNMMH